MRARVEQARVARLATVRPDGRPHVVPCCFVLSNEVLYSAVDAKPKSTSALRRLDNIRAVPWIAMLVDHYADDWAALWWIRIDGRARVIDSGPEFDHALQLLAGKYEQYLRDMPPPGHRDRRHRLASLAVIRHSHSSSSALPTSARKERS